MDGGVKPSYDMGATTLSSLHVIAGPDPAIHLGQKSSGKMDPRGKPGDDSGARLTRS